MPETIEQVISEPQMSILQSTANVNLFLAGTGSGKTFLGGILSINFIKNFPEVRGAIFSNTFDQLNTSTLFRIREYWSSIGVTEWAKENPSGTYTSGKEPPPHWTKCKRNFDRFNNIISFCNGGLIFTGSLDNYMSHSGKEFCWCLLDETKDTKEEALKEVIITRLRQPGMFVVNGVLSHTGMQSEQWNPLYCLTSPARVDWLNEMFELEKYIDEISAKIYSDETFFEKEFNNKKVVISSTYHNVHNVGINYINNILANNSEERGKALVYANPFSTTGGEYYSSFNRLKHVVKCKYNPELPLHLSFDQNTVPYNSCGISQITNENGIWNLYYIDEIALQNPRNSTEEVCEEFMMRYPNHKSGLFFYGDASGHSRSTLNKDFKHHYEIIEFKLRNYLVNGSDRTLRKNPSIIKRRDFVNLILEEKLPIRIYINESNRYMIADFMYTRQDVEGKKDKHIVEDKETGEKYQKYGHFGDLCFSGDTMIITSKGEKRIDLIKQGEKVLTRKGYKTVLSVHNNGIKKVSSYMVGENHLLTCTPEHHVYTETHNFMSISLIKSDTFCIFQSKRLWKNKLSVTEVSRLTDIPVLKGFLIDVIIMAGLILMGIGAKLASMFLHGFAKEDQFQMVMKSIIFMAILMITILIILNVLRWFLTDKNIIRILRTSIKERVKIGLLILHRKRQRFGMDLLKGWHGIKRMLKLLFLGQREVSFVQNVAMSSSQPSDKTKSNFVVQNVNQNSMPEFGDLVIQGERTVYDLTIEDEHEYFANHVLVHNCEYQLVDLFKNFYNG